jgi:HD-GYP domain-containing protein (c-di-GMP phosphodiesterase class II)
MYPSNHSIHRILEELIQSQPLDLLRHSQSVALLASNLSEAEGCSVSERDRIHIGSLLHDIGKQFVPSSILEKKGKLSPAEFRQIQQHPWSGYAYLINFISDATILNTVLYHHERWNGTGYPYGLEQDEIPLGARICALADVWDALTSDRCYRSAWTMSQAVDLLWAGAGSIFDPHLTFQFINMLEEGFNNGNAANLQEPTHLSIAGQSRPALESLTLTNFRRGQTTGPE